MATRPSPFLRRTSFAAVTATGIFGAIGASSAATSQKIQLVGRVLPHADVWLSRLYLGLTSHAAYPSNGFSLADLGVRGNGSKFVVSLVSQSARQSGQTSLVDPASGTAIGYRLTYGGAKIDFVKGEARLATSDKNVAATPRPLELKMPISADLSRGHFQERIIVVITAR